MLITNLLANKNCIHEEIKCGLKAGNSYYYSKDFIFFFSSWLHSKSLNNKIYETIILPVMLYGCET